MRTKSQEQRAKTRDTRHETRGRPHLRDSGSQGAPSRPRYVRAPSPTFGGGGEDTGLGSRVSGLGSRVSGLGSRVSCLGSRVSSAVLRREKPRGSLAFASPSRGSQSKQLAPFRSTSDSGLTLRLRCRLGSSVLRFYPSPFGRCRSMRHPKVPYGRRPTLRQCGVTRRDLGGPDGHWHLSPKSEAPIRGADRSRYPGHSSDRSRPSE